MIGFVMNERWYLWKENNGYCSKTKLIHKYKLDFNNIIISILLNISSKTVHCSYMKSTLYKTFWILGSFCTITSFWKQIMGIKNWFWEKMRGFMICVKWNHGPKMQMMNSLSTDNSFFWSINENNSIPQLKLCSCLSFNSLEFNQNKLTIVPYNSTH